MRSAAISAFHGTLPCSPKWICHSVQSRALETGPFASAEALGATEYINPPGGAKLFDRAEFDRRKIRLTIQEPFEFSYDCPGYKFEPSLSVIDALMWNGPASLKAHLDQVKAQSAAKQDQTPQDEHV